MFFGTVGSYSFYSIQCIIAVEFLGIRNSSSEIKEGFSVGFQVANNNYRKDNEYEEKEHMHGNEAQWLHVYLFRLKMKKLC
jgi:hypothetical protein